LFRENKQQQVDQTPSSTASAGGRAAAGRREVRRAAIASATGIFTPLCGAGGNPKP